MTKREYDRWMHRRRYLPIAYQNTVAKLERLKAELREEGLDEVLHG